MHLDEKYLDPVMEAISKPGRTNGHYVMVCYVFCDGHNRVVVSYVLGLTVSSINSYMI
jgi:hypothetical protein